MGARSLTATNRRTRATPLTPTPTFARPGKTLFMDHSTIVVGTLNVNPHAPQDIELDEAGKVKIKGGGKKDDKDKKKAEEDNED